MHKLNGDLATASQGMIVAAGHCAWPALARSGEVEVLAKTSAVVTVTPPTKPGQHL